MPICHCRNGGTPGTNDDPADKGSGPTFSHSGWTCEDAKCWRGRRDWEKVQCVLGILRNPKRLCDSIKEKSRAKWPKDLNTKLRN